MTDTGPDFTGDLAALVRDPLWHAHRYDAAQDAFHFRHVPRQQHRKATFLTDEYLGDAARIVAVKRPEALAAGAGRAPIHFVFHSAFCASTMLVRALDVPGLAMGLSEPVLCNDMMGWRWRGAERRQVAAVLDASLALLQRPFGLGEAVVVKPSNVFNPLIQAVMALRPESRALLLYAPLPVFLASVARKGLWCRLWARELLEGQLREGMVDMGFGPADFFRQSDLQVAAIGWLAQHRLFGQIAQALGPQRIATLDSETLTGNQQGSLSSVARHFGLGLTPALEGAMLAGPALTSHSKFGQAFSAEDRAAEQYFARKAYGDEIDKVHVWAMEVARVNGIAIDLPHRLQV
ncbi:hypothetical protein [Blastomonas sp. SL216]|uniref:hypothetical protein n=1 Tax=Blastomonas sp. SL216 TaxID=2995169 RepID=UPI00237704E8|nr:hypothetical protein OU999_10970 [Blastomonas sp. SL216]